MSTPPTITLYRNSKTGDFLLLNFARDPNFGFCVAYGELIHVPAVIMERDGLDTVLRELHDFPNRNSNERAEIERMTKEQLRQFESEHREVGVTLQESPAQLSLNPMKRIETGAAIGPEASSVIVALPSTNRAFADALRRAFAACQ